MRRWTSCARKRKRNFWRIRKVTFSLSLFHILLLPRSHSPTFLIRSPGDLPRILSNPASLYPTLLIHSTPSARLNPEYTDSPSSSRALRDLSEIPGIYTIKLELPPPTSLPLAQTTNEGKEDQGWYRAHLERGVPISKKVGRRLLDALGIRFEGGDGRGGEKRERMAEGERGGKTTGELLVSVSSISTRAIDCGLAEPGKYS